jgi:hypothetical protein
MHVSQIIQDFHLRDLHSHLKGSSFHHKELNRDHLHQEAILFELELNQFILNPIPNK